jgi:Holliday junction resolvasome RuvABC endonuclease subunit
MLSLGLDMSCSASGVVLLTHDDAKKPIVLHHEVIKYPKLTGVARAQAIVLHVMELVHGKGLRQDIDRIVIEGYSLGKFASSTIPLVELGGLLRFMLKLDGYPWLDPRAVQVKKFGSGSGNAKKNMMVMSVYKRWGFEAKDDNEADAYVCACIGLLHAGKLTGSTQDMQKIVGELATRCN